MNEKIVIPAEQGDVTLIEATIPSDVLKSAKKKKTTNGRTILALGEVTGHHHSLDSHKAYVLEPNPELCKLFNAQVGISPNANILDGVLVVNDPDILIHGDFNGGHGDHNPIEIGQGVRWIVIEQEYTPGKIQRTAD
jgi:hypothetical protein